MAGPFLRLALGLGEAGEIGAGGGSIARIDALGLLKVGPDSAGAAPGPACYGRGGTEATASRITNDYLASQRAGGHATSRPAQRDDGQDAIAGTIDDHHAVGSRCVDAIADGVSGQMRRWLGQWDLSQQGQILLIQHGQAR